MVSMSEVFYVGLYTALIGFTLSIARYAYKSKCSKINVCCIKIERNIEGEIKEDELEMQNSRATRQEQEEKSNINNI